MAVLKLYGALNLSCNSINLASTMIGYVYGHSKPGGNGALTANQFVAFFARCRGSSIKS